MAEVMVDNGEQYGGNGGRTYNWFCVYCWQHYLCNYRHIARMCKECRILRKLGTFSANNNGQQWADTEEANAQLD